MKIRHLTVVAVVGLVSALGACGGDDATPDAAAPATEAPSESAEPAADGPVVVASTSWVGAFAALAGAEDITIIAPSNLQHPPDYDPKASDIASVADADFILIAGFEGFADRMKEAAGSDAEVVTVATEYYPDALAAEVTRLAELMGLDVAEAKHNIEHYREHWMMESERVKAAVPTPAPVIVSHLYTGVWAALAGLEPASTFGPEPVTAAQVASIVKLAPTVILENSHMPAGADLAEATGATQVDIINFPGDDMDLKSVITKNADALIAAFGG